MESIEGPHRGFYVTAYATPCADGRHYAAYAKVCTRRPSEYWEAACVFKVFGGEHHLSARSALAAANRVAAAQIARLPAIDISRLGFPMFDESRQVVFPLARAILSKSIGLRAGG